MLRAVIEMRSEFPPNLAEAEVEGIGIDLFTEAGDYQLFASGEPSGWFAYLSTPDGFTRYPGDFSVRGSTLVFTIPWDSIGGEQAGEFSFFVDWTVRRSDETLFSQDTGPASGTSSYDPD